LPVSLDYHTSGVKVNELSDWVGAGWNLSAGGMITRTIQGLPDESTFGFWTTYQQLYSCGNTIPVKSETERTVAAGIVNKSIDGEPDLFSFNIGGYSGKFYFDYISDIRTPILLSEQDIKIIETVDNTKPEAERIRGFKLITPDGIIYWFGEKDNKSAQELLYAFGANAVFVSWQLLKIESPDGKNSINFDYQDDIYQYYVKGGRTINYYYETAQGPGGTSNSDTGLGGSQNIILGKKLLKISTTNESIDFKTTADRSDTYAYGGSLGKKLNSIEIKTGSVTSSTAYCKKFNLIFDYFKAAPNLTSAFTLKLRLKSLQELSCDNTSVVIPEHKFMYNGDFFPEIGSRSVDHWGYYNGAPNTGSDLNIPATTINVTPLTSNITQVTHGSSNRETNEIEMLKGSLTRITYPTGGYTNYTFEANDYCKDVFLKPNSTSNKVLIDRSACVQDEVKGMLFSIEAKDSLSQCLLSVDLCVTDTKFPQKTYTVIPFVVLQLIDLNGNEIDRFDFDSVVYTFNTYIQIKKIFPRLQFGKSYQIKIPSNSAICSEFSPSIQFSLINKDTFETSSQTKDSNKPLTVKVGGLRIKKILQHDGIDSINNIEKTYTYTNGSCSSGKLLAMPKYSYYEGFSTNNSIYIPNNGCTPWSAACTPASINQLTFYENSIVPLSTFEGYHVVYEKVTEFTGDPTYSDPIPIYNQVEYSFLPADPVTSDPIPYPYLSSQQLLSGGQFSSMQNINSPYSETVTQYSRGEKYSQHYFFVAEWDQITYNSSACNPNYPEYSGEHYNFRGYNIRSGNYKVKEKKTLMDGLTVTVGTEYSSTLHHFPTAITQTNSDGKVHRTEFAYNTNYTINTTIGTDLKNRNIISTPWKTSIKVDGVEVDGSELEYAYFNLSTGANQISGTSGFPRLYKKHRYERTWDANNVLTGTGKQLQTTISAYDGIGYVKTSNSDGWADENYEWTSDGLIKKKTFKDFTWEYSYMSGTRLLSSIKDKDGQISNFEYDPLMRLKKKRLELIM
jgi:hypothetical protein